LYKYTSTSSQNYSKTTYPTVKQGTNV